MKTLEISGARPRSELRRFLWWVVGCIAIAHEAPVSRFGHAVAKRVTQLGAVGLALLPQLLQAFGICSKRLRRHGWFGFSTSHKHHDKQK